MDSKMVLAEIHVDRVDPNWWTYRLFAPTLNLHDQVGAAPTPDAVVWSAVDKLRSDGDRPLSGRLAIFSDDHLSVAYVPLWCVPQYRDLKWTPLAEEVLLPGPDAK